MRTREEQARKLKSAVRYEGTAVVLIRFHNAVAEGEEIGCVLWSKTPSLPALYTPTEIAYECCTDGAPPEAH